MNRIKGGVIMSTKRMWLMLVLGVVACTGQAANWTQSGAGAFSWSDSNNWDAAVPNGNADNAVLTNNITGDQTVNLNAAITIGSMDLGDVDGSSRFTLANGSGGGLTWNKLGDWYSHLTQQSYSKGDTIAATMTLNNHSALLINNYATNPLTLSGAINGSGGGGVEVVAGTVVLSGANTFDGQSWIQGGTLVVIHTNGLGNSVAPFQFYNRARPTLEFANDGVGDNGTILYGSATNPLGYSLQFLSYDHEVYTVKVGPVSTNVGNTIQLNDFTFGYYAQRLAVVGTNDYGLKFAGTTYVYSVNAGYPSIIEAQSAPVTLNEVVVSSGGTGGLALDGAVSGSSIIGSIDGSLWLYKYGLGAWTLAGANTYIGQTVLSAGTLEVTHTNGLGNCADPVFFSAPLTTLKLANDGAGNNGTILYGSPTNPTGYNLEMGLFYPNPSVVTVNVDHVSANTGNTIQLGNFKFPVNNWSERLVVTGGHDYTLKVAGTTYIRTADWNDDIIEAQSANVILNDVNSPSGVGWGLTLDGLTTGNRVNGTIGNGPFYVSKSGPGVWTLAGSNTFGASLCVKGGTLRLAHPYAMPGGIGAGPCNNYLEFRDGGGVLELGADDFKRGVGYNPGGCLFSDRGGFSAFGGNRIVNMGGVGAQVHWSNGMFIPGGKPLLLNSTTADSAIDFQNALHLDWNYQTIQVDDNPNTNTDYAIISGELSVGGMIKTGDGTLSLSASSSLYLPSTVSNGTLLVDGALLDGGTNITVTSGGSLGGTGTVASALTVLSGGTLVPGGFNALGTLTLAGTGDFQSGARITAKVAGDAYSTVVVNGSLSLPSTGTVVVTNLTGTTLPTRMVLLSATSLSAPDLSGWTVVGGKPGTRIALQGNELQLVTPSGSVIRIY